MLFQLDAIDRENKVRVTMQSRDPENFPLITCITDTSRYPELKTAEEGHELWIRGEIPMVDSYLIQLENRSLEPD